MTMQLLDSNILIYSAKPEFAYLRKLIVQSNYVSVISKIEVLGYHKLNEKDANYLTACFNVLSGLTIDNNVIEKAIEIRKENNLSVADSIIAATCLLFNLELKTNNIADFKNVKGLKTDNPVK